MRTQKWKTDFEKMANNAQDLSTAFKLSIRIVYNITEKEWDTVDV
jgi:hypothetical protein